MIDALKSLLSLKTDLLGTILISAFVSAGVAYWFKRRETRYAAEITYQYEQRKKLRELIGRYHGRLLNAANSMNYRLWNLYLNHDKGWLSRNCDHANADGYYFKTSVYRFLNVSALVRQIEFEALLLDPKIAKKNDFTFLNYIAALHWAMTDVALTDGLPYDHFYQTDHFFSDQFRQYCDFCTRNGAFISMDEFSELLQEDNEKIEPILQYFDGLQPNEPRLRWDRLVTFHLLLLAFINSFGYARQYSNQAKFTKVAKQVRNQQVLRNLANWLPLHDLGRDKEAKKIIRAAIEAAA